MNRKSTFIGLFFFGAGVLVAYTMHKLLVLVLSQLRWDNPPILGDGFPASAALGVLLGAAAAFGAFAWPKSKTYVTEVVDELDKVNWPSWPETRMNTFVVIITSVIAALILGVFDITFGKASAMLVEFSEQRLF